MLPKPIPVSEVTESPELPNWVKFFDTKRPEKADLDEDFVIPSLANWVEAQKLRDPRKAVKRPLSETADTDDIDKVCRILKNGYPSPENAVQALDGCVLDLSNSLVERVLRRFSNEWVPAFGFFTWAKAQTGYRHPPEVYNSMVDILGKSENFELMWEMVEEMVQIGGGYVTLDTMSKVMRRLARAGRYKEAIDAFRGITQFGVSKDVLSLNTLMGALVKERSVEHAHEVFLEFNESIPLNSQTFNVLIHGWCKPRKLDILLETQWRRWRSTDFRKVDEVLGEMKDKACEPNTVTYTIIMHALGKAREITKALEVYEKMKRSGCVPDTSFYNSLIFLLGKAGRLKDVQEVVEDMTNQGVKLDTLTHNTLISSACAHSQEEAALKLLKKMEEESCKPDLKTYAPLLKLFCRKKRMRVLCFLLDHMFKNDVSIEGGTYALLVRGLCSNGKLENACSFFEEMVSKGFVPKDSTYNMLIKELEGKSMEKEKKHVEKLMLQAKEQEI
ncbi:pentatricopeptide repeat-containing protein [Prunus yedoensis var. nudiflora]|uniref:Pentatricopeptide repeat-containing protein n=1 Tax=Prunus yedoensis var. nudiflora TaxID=2094558 RepID=A0A314YLR3_PRUYE|nr:pentatricopeptide repeat-containing protein [Prunus yedoensis var. nudiflora]